MPGRDKAETARRTALQAEQVRAEVVKLRSSAADDITALATQARKKQEASVSGKVGKLFGI